MPSCLGGLREAVGGIIFYNIKYKNSEDYIIRITVPLEPEMLFFDTRVH